MNRKSLLYFVLAILISTLQINSQTTNYSVKKINDKDYFTYTVQTGEGLYTISKRFNVTQAEITEINPDVVSGLKPSQEILIPINSANRALAKAENSKQNIAKENNDFVEHTVLKKQTLFAISQQYKVAISDIQNANPQIVNGLQEGMVLKIPKIKTDTTKTKTNNAKIENNTINQTKNVVSKPTSDIPEFLEHRVKLKETLYSISKLHNVSVDDILKYNPEAKESLKWGSKLKIINKKPEKQVVKDTEIVSKPKINLEDKLSIAKISKPIITNKVPIRIAFLLPFMLENAKADASNQRFIEFYSGALLAINEAKDFGVSFEIYTYDTGKSEDKMNEVLQNEELKKVDLIIGPAYTQQIPLISNFAMKNKINTLVPFSSKVYDVNINPYLLQFNPGLDVQVQFMAQILNNEYKNKEIIFCEVPAVSVLDDGYEFSYELKNELKRLKRDFLTMDADSIISPITYNKLKSTKNTVLLFNTDKLLSVSNYLDSINSKPILSNIEILTQISWQSSTTNLRNFYISPFKLDLNSLDYKKYSVAFYKSFLWRSVTNVPQFDIIGYDLTNYFTALLYQNGSNVLNQKTKLPNYEGIQSNLHFERKSDKSGFMNQKVYFLQNN